MGIATAETENRLNNEESEFFDEMVHEAQLRDQEAMDSDPDYADWLEKMATDGKQERNRPDSEAGVEHRRAAEGHIVGCT